MTIYTRIVEILQDQLSVSGIPQDQAIKYSALAVDRLREEVGGVNVYLSKKSPWQNRRIRNTAIRKRFNGQNLREICTKHKVSRSTVYRVCNKKSY
ncbi:MAG: hypothetical protein GY799_13060 [Desulfobulbaceae bacterium]|nr:hypothetical protein [Desulfobulbaceae bacterium]